jgi:Uma2 family endonuclease
MTALTVDHMSGNGHDWDDVVRIWEDTDAPEGCKVEIIEGIVTVAPPPSYAHNLTAAKLQRQLYKTLPRDWGIFQTVGLTISGKRGLYLPDLAVIPEDALISPENRLVAGEAKLVVEITSRDNANHDRVGKTHGYAQAEVPLYLLLDPWHSARPTATLYGEPRGGTYRTLGVIKYGETIHLPEPFDLDIDTGMFPVP